MQSLIFDTSALFNFGHRGEMEALLAEFGGCYRLVTTDEVKKESCGPPHAKYYERFIDRHFHLERAAQVRLPLDVLARLSRVPGSGELSVILLGLSVAGAYALVIDERPARYEAATQGLAVAGTIGLLKEAIGRRWRTDAECVQAVRLLVERKFRVRDLAHGETFVGYFNSLGQGQEQFPGFIRECAG